MKTQKQLRKIEYEGDQNNDSLLIGNFGDVEFTAKGNFELSGMIYSKKSVAFNIIGNGRIKFHGVCGKIIIHIVKGNCILDFSDLTSSEVCCVSLRDNSTTMIGPTKIISRANLQDEAVLRYKGTPRLQSYTLSGSSRIEAMEAVLA